MAPKKGNPSPSVIPPSSTKATHITPSSAGQPTKPQNKAPQTSTSSASASSSIRNAQDAQQIAVGMWNNYVDKTPQRVKLLDVFMVFLMVVGVLQFVYCVIAGNYVSGQTSWQRRAQVQWLTNDGSLSMLSCPASQRQSVNSCSRPVCECRRTRRTRANLAAYHTRGTYLSRRHHARL